MSANFLFEMALKGSVVLVVALAATQLSDPRLKARDSGSTEVD